MKTSEAIALVESESQRVARLEVAREQVRQEREQERQLAEEKKRSREAKVRQDILAARERKERALAEAERVSAEAEFASRKLIEARNAGERECRVLRQQITAIDEALDFSRGQREGVQGIIDGGPETFTGSLGNGFGPITHPIQLANHGAVIAGARTALEFFDTWQKVKQAERDKLQTQLDEAMLAHGIVPADASKEPFVPAFVTTTGA